MLIENKGVKIKNNHALTAITFMDDKVLLAETQHKLKNTTIIEEREKN